MHELHELQIAPIIIRALEEDWGYGDWTTDICVPAHTKARARIIAKEDLVVAGIDVAKAVLKKVDPSLEVVAHAQNGDRLTGRPLLLEIRGEARSIQRASAWPSISSVACAAWPR